jgi:hypothetical protein
MGEKKKPTHPSLDGTEYILRCKKGLGLSTTYSKGVDVVVEKKQAKPPLYTSNGRSFAMYS